MQMIWKDDDGSTLDVQVYLKDICLADISVGDIVEGEWAVDSTPFVIAALKDAVDALEHCYKQVCN